MSKELPDDWIVCDCCVCGRILLGDAMRYRYATPTLGYWFVAARVDGRPYCKLCLRSRQASQRAALAGVK